MSQDDLLKLVVVQLPNFLGLLIALYLQREQNKALLEELRRCNERNSDNPPDNT